MDFKKATVIAVLFFNDFIMRLPFYFSVWVAMTGDFTVCFKWCLSVLYFGINIV